MEEQQIAPQPKQALPNGTTVLVLGIISIVSCWCTGIIGVALGIIALVLAKKAKLLYTQSPELYTESSYGNMKAGKVCAIIGICLSSFTLLYYLFYFIFIGAMMSSLPWEEIMNQAN